MTTYMSAEENNQMVKTMMLQNNCNHVSGDDSNDYGFRLMIKEDDECECNVVRNLRTDENIGIHVNNKTNSLFLYDRKEAMKTLISGGGIATVTTLGGNSVISIRFRFNCIISFRPLERTETINVDMRFLSNGGSEGQWIRLFPTGTFRIPTDVGVQLDTNNAMYLTVDPSFMGMPQRGQHPNLIIADTRNVDVINRSSDTYLLCYRDDSDRNNRFIHWVPTDTKIPFTVPGNATTITYNIDTGEKSWVSEVETIDFSSLQTISGGGVVTYRNTQRFRWVSWDRGVVISHIPTSDQNKTNIFIEMPLKKKRLKILMV